MQFHRAFAEIEPQAGTHQGILLVGEPGVLFKKDPLLLDGNAGTLVLNEELNLLFGREQMAADDNLGAVLGVTQGVGQQILQDAQDQHPVQVEGPL